MSVILDSLKLDHKQMQSLKLYIYVLISILYDLLIVTGSFKKKKLKFYGHFLLLVYYIYAQSISGLQISHDNFYLSLDIIITCPCSTVVFNFFYYGAEQYSVQFFSRNKNRNICTVS